MFKEKSKKTALIAVSCKKEPPKLPKDLFFYTQKLTTLKTDWFDEADYINNRDFLSTRTTDW